MQERLLNDTIQQMNKLYIMYRRAYLEQFETGYITKKFTLNDYTLKQHLTLKKTVGVKLGTQGLTKFLTFDVDYKDNIPKAKQVTERIIQHLHDYYAIEFKDIHADFSGSKGYHVTLFFDEVIQDKALKPFYEEVLRDLGLSVHEVEFRCSSQYGLKLPLGINQKSKAFMCFCNYNIVNKELTHLSKKESYTYFNNIVQSSLASFKELILDDLDVYDNDLKALTLTQDKAEEFENIMSEININGKSVEELENELKIVLENNRLSYKSSRNRITFLLSIFLKEQGNSEQDTLNYIVGVLLNTYHNSDSRALISADTTVEYMSSEAKRIVHQTYVKGYSLTERRKDVFITKEEVLEVLEIKEYHLKKLLFSMLIHSKRYAKANGVFYMAYSTMSAMGNTKERSRLLKHISELEQKEKVLIISRNQLDKTRTLLEKHVMSKPNSYKVGLISSDIVSDKSLKLDFNSQLTLEQVTALLLDKKETRSILPRNQWQNNFSKEYKAI